VAFDSAMALPIESAAANPRAIEAPRAFEMFIAVAFIQKNRLPD